MKKGIIEEPTDVASRKRTMDPITQSLPASKRGATVITMPRAVNKPVDPFGVQQETSAQMEGVEQEESAPERTMSRAVSAPASPVRDPFGVQKETAAETEGMGLVEESAEEVEESEEEEEEVGVKAAARMGAVARMKALQEDPLDALIKLLCEEKSSQVCVETPAQRRALTEFRGCCKQLIILWNKIPGDEEWNDEDEDVPEADREAAKEVVIEEEKNLNSGFDSTPGIQGCREEGGDFFGRGGMVGGTPPIRPRIFSIRRPSVRRFLIALLCCLRNLARTCKFAADIMKIILAILTMGATLGVSSFILYLVAQLVQKLGCAGWTNVAGSTADFCSCTLGMAAAGAIGGVSLGQAAIIIAGLGLGGLVAWRAANGQGRVNRILHLIRGHRRGRAAEIAELTEEQNREIATFINTRLDQSWSDWFNTANGLLSDTGNRFFNYLCPQDFRANADAWLINGIPADWSLIMHEISILMRNDLGPRPGGLIGNRSEDSGMDLTSLNNMLRAMANSGGPYPTVRGLLSRTRRDFFEAGRLQGTRWWLIMGEVTHWIQTRPVETRDQLRQMWNAASRVAAAIPLLIPSRPPPPPSEVQQEPEAAEPAAEEPQSLAIAALLVELAAAQPAAGGGGYPRRRRTKRRSKSKRRTKSRRRRTLRKTSKRTRKTNVRRKFTRKSTKKLSRRRSRKLSRK